MRTTSTRRAKRTLAELGAAILFGYGEVDWKKTESGYHFIGPGEEGVAPLPSPACLRRPAFAGLPSPA
jgi:hypothetical protein